MPHPRVLLIRLSSLGDLIVLTSTLSLLETAGAEVDLLTKREYFPIFKGDPRVRRLIPFERGIRGILRTARSLRSERYDVAFDLHVKPATLALLLLSGAAHRARYRKRSLSRHLAVRAHRTLPEVPVAELYARPVLRLLELETGIPDPEIRGFRTPAGAPKPPYAVLVPGGRSRTKRWPEDHYRALARELSAAGETVVLAGDRGDAGLCARIRGDDPKIVDLSGRTDLPALAGLLHGARYAVANDSGPAHLAAAVGTPLYVFFGPTHPSFGFRPRGSRVRVLEREMDCRPCALHGEDRCPHPVNHCLARIPPETVLDLLLREHPPSPSRD
jgi:ADP-heptose:LPS heptosyltransferase